MAKEKQLPNTNIHQRSSETRTSTQLIQLINNHQVDGHKKKPQRNNSKKSPRQKSPKIHNPPTTFTHTTSTQPKSKEWLWIVFLAQLVLFLHLIFTNVTSRQSHGGLQWYLGAIVDGEDGGVGSTILPPTPPKMEDFSLKRDTFTRYFHGTQASIFVSFQGG